MAIPAGFDNPGDRIEVFAQAEIAGGATGLGGVYLRVEEQRDGVSADYRDLVVDGNMGAMPANPAAETLDFWCPVTVRSGERNFFYGAIAVYMVGAGTANIRLRHLAADKRPL